MLFFSLLMFYAVLVLSLHYFMLPLYSQDFLERNWLAGADTALYPLIALLCATGVAFIASLSARLPSRFFMVLLAAFPVLPMIALYSYRGAATPYLLMTVTCYALLAIIVRLPFKGVGSSLSARLAPITVVYAAIGGLGVFIGASILLGNLRYLNFDFSDVYQFREAAIESRNSALEYLLTNLTGFFVPLSIAMTVHYRKYGMLALLLVAMLLVFGLASHRSHILMPIFVISAFLALRYDFGQSLFIGGLAIVCLLGIAAFVFLGSENLGVITIRRMFFVPAYANFLYHDFFSVSQTMNWSDSRLTFGFLNNPYGMHGSRVIMNYYSDSNFYERLSNYNTANTGFIGAGYGHARFAGMIFYTLIVGILMKFADVIGSKIGYVTVSAGLCNYFATVLFSSSDTLSSFLTYGSIFMIILALVLRPERDADGVVSQAGSASFSVSHRYGQPML
ncbi:hypothetical protein [Sphingomonas sp. SUN039]|uniref:hypothetical protein n=1 Tax=Sphingomonas sp. SUN039 TaxID=2937787 RepID=UPI002164E2A7|nr:hypothetical protein [Sphingomonas sp. SUN039]UVO52840.1 hypothetical protein M0209_01405 [Sphingomonas sp. SUN039]